MKFVRDWRGEMNVQYHLFSNESGGAAHCQIGNMSLSHAVIFDWLEHTVIQGEPHYLPLLRDLDMRMIEDIRRGK